MCDVLSSEVTYQGFKYQLTQNTMFDCIISIKLVFGVLQLSAKVCRPLGFLKIKLFFSEAMVA